MAYPKPSLLYISDLFNSNLVKFELQLDNYTDDIRYENSFKGLTNLVDLSVKLVQTRRYKVYDIVYNFLKLILLLQMATTKC